MRKVLWVTRPELAAFAGGQHEAAQEQLRRDGWHVTQVSHQPRFSWRQRGACDLLVWTFVPNRLDVWQAKPLAKVQLGVVQEFGPRAEPLPALDLWTTPSRSLKAALCDRGANPAAVSVGLQSPAFLYDASRSLRDALGVSPQSRLIYAAGPLTAPAGNRLAIWALNILNYTHPEVHLVLHGEGEERERLEHFHRSIDENRRVHFVTGDWKPAELVAQADQVWIPRLHDGMPDAFLLALKRGVPLLTTRLPSLTEWLRDGDNALLLRPDRPADWAAAAHRLLEDPPLAIRLAAAAKNTTVTESDFASCLRDVFPARHLVAA